MSQDILDTRPAVIYHKGCTDGFGAAWAAWRSREMPATRFLAAAPEEPPPELGHPEVVYIVDVSFTPEDMQQLHHIHGSENVVLLDHHQSAQEKLEGLPNCHFDLSKAGAVMAWQHFHPSEEIPELLLYVQDRDLWQWEMPDSRAVSAYLHSQPRRFERWNQINNALRRRNAARDKIVEAGNAILLLEERTIRSALSRVQYGRIDGHIVPIVNSQVLRSEIGNALALQNPGHPFAAVYYDTRSTRRWSLRSAPGGHNVAEVATRLGGGGHARAAAFTQRIGAPGA